MCKSLGALLLVIAILGSAMTMGCSSGKKDTPAPEITPDALKNVPTKGTSAPKPKPPPP
jgi:hypothetical protein